MMAVFVLGLRSSYGDVVVHCRDHCFARLLSSWCSSPRRHFSQEFCLLVAVSRVGTLIRAISYLFELLGFRVFGVDNSVPSDPKIKMKFPRVVLFPAALYLVGTVISGAETASPSRGMAGSGKDEKSIIKGPGRKTSDADTQSRQYARLTE